jgi:hypothetical protein
MINTILLSLILIILFIIIIRISKTKERTCPDVSLSCPDLSCPESKCPDCPVPECPKPECPEAQLSCPDCPKLECPQCPQCPEIKCPSVDHYLNRIDELTDENRRHKEKVCPTQAPCMPVKKLIFEPKIVENDELVFSVKSSHENQKMKISYNGAYIISNEINLTTDYEYYNFKIKGHLFVETIEISIYGEGEVSFYDSQIIFKNKNILKNEIRYYDHRGDLIYNFYPESKLECQEGKLKHSGYLKIFVNPENDLDKYFM